MKKFFIIFKIALFLSDTAFAQKVVYRTQNPNIGFGTSSEVANNKYLDFVVNGPLLHHNNSPVGGYIDNQQQAKPWVQAGQQGGNFAIANVIFGLGTDGILYMIPSENATELPKMQWAFQNGPALVYKGQNIRGTSATKYLRSGIGYKKDGTLVVIVTTEPITFRDFAQYFVNEDCWNAVYLDGGPYVGYADKDTHFGMKKEALKLQFYNN